MFNFANLLVGMFFVILTDEYEFARSHKRKHHQANENGSQQEFVKTMFSLSFRNRGRWRSSSFGGVGTESSPTFVGIPALVLTPTLPPLESVQFPRLRMFALLRAGECEGHGAHGRDTAASRHVGLLDSTVPEPPDCPNTRKINAFSRS